MNINRHYHLVTNFGTGLRTLAGPGTLAPIVAAVAILAANPVLAQVANPPPLPQSVTVFPQRDFTSISGFKPNANLSVKVKRAGVGVISEANGRTDGVGSLEVNHPGGVCWAKGFPDISPGDTVEVTYDNSSNSTAFPPNGTGSATSTQDVEASQAKENFSRVYSVVITGKTLSPDPTSKRIPLEQLEVRLVNPSFITTKDSRITKRDIRVTSTGVRVEGNFKTPVPTGILRYDSANSNNFTAVFYGLNAVERKLAVEAQTRVLAWQRVDKDGERLGMTIYEVGEIGGPMGGCPPGPNAVIVPPAPPTQPANYEPKALRSAAISGEQPGLKDVVVFPERDFVSVSGYSAGTELQVVVRRGDYPPPAQNERDVGPVEGFVVVGTARGIVDGDGLFEVNHPGGVCWSGQTPNIAPNDWVDVYPVNDMGLYGQTQRVIDAKVTQTAAIKDRNVQVFGSAVGAKGSSSHPLAFVEQRIINPDFKNTSIGRRDIRADINGGRVNTNGRGNLVQTGDKGEWSATYIGLDPTTEQPLAIAGQNRAMAWLSTDTNGNRYGLTIYEAGEVGGPGMGGCPSTGNAMIKIR